MLCFGRGRPTLHPLAEDGQHYIFPLRLTRMRLAGFSERPVLQDARMPVIKTMVKQSEVYCESALKESRATFTANCGFPDFIRCWMLNVRCWMFEQIVPRPLLCKEPRSAPPLHPRTPRFNQWLELAKSQILLSVPGQEAVDFGF